MPLIAVYIIFVVCTFSLFAYLFHTSLSARDATEMLAAALFWPVVTLIMLYIISIDKYREYKFDKIRQVVRSYGDMDLEDAISRMNLKDLQRLKNAALLGFYDVSDRNMERIEKRMLDKKFEDAFLDRDHK